MQEGPEFDSIVRPGMSVWSLGGFFPDTPASSDDTFLNYILSQSTDAIITVTTTAVVS